jgi:hypothetical protein
MWTQPIPADPHDSHGRGLFLIDSLARGWGVEPSATGKTVWFEVAVQPRR